MEEAYKMFAQKNGVSTDAINAFMAVREKFESGYYRSMPIPMMADPYFRVK